MGFQQTVYVQQAAGVPGEFFDNSPHRAIAYPVVSNGAAAPTYGYAFTRAAASDPAMVGLAAADAMFLGIGVNPKEGMAYNSLAPTMSVPDGSTMGLCTFGRIFVKAGNAITEGLAGFFRDTDGAIFGFAAGSSQTGYTEIPNSRFIKADAAQGEIAILELGN